MSKSSKPSKHTSKSSRTTPYPRSTRSSNRKEVNDVQSTQEHSDQDPSSNMVTQLELPSSSHEGNSNGPSWNDFNKLKESVNQMHDLLKSFKNHTVASLNSVDSDNVTQVDMVVDNQISRPREAGESSNVNTQSIPSPNMVAAAEGNAVSQSSISEYLKSFLHSGTNDNYSETKFDQPGRPIDLKINEKVRQKIWSDQYIDLASLLDPQVHSEIGLTITSDPGEPLKFTPAKSNKVIGNLGQWCSAFEIFIIIYCQKKPAELSPLMTYMNSIKTLSHRGGDYLWYDREFRYLRQTMKLSWDTVHSGLWLECREMGKVTKYKNKSNNGSDNFRGKSQQANSKQHPFGYCFRYHNFGKCGRSACKFKHSCYECNDEVHSFIRCPKNQKNNSSENRSK